jgi:hypothetical protein
MIDDPTSSRALTLRIALLLWAAPLAAATTVTLERAGTPVEHGEVCRFPAGDRENPFKRWLTSQKLECVPAGSPMAFADGLWNVFGRQEGAAISNSRLIDAAAVPQTLSLALEPAATVAATMPPGATGVLFAPRRGTAVPAIGRTTVPAGEELWLFVLEKSSITSVVPIAALQAATEKTVDARAGGPAAVIGWIQVPEADRPALANARTMPAPSVRVGRDLTSDPLPPLDVLNGAFVRVRGVAADDVDLELGGRGWVSDRRRVHVSSSVSVAPVPLLARPAATLIINWSTEGDLRDLERSLGVCDDKETAARYEISLASCPPPPRPNEMPDPSSCTVIRRESIDLSLKFGTFTAEDVPPGLYRGELRIGKLPPVSNFAFAPALQVRTMSVYASYFEIHGSVMHGGEPLEEDIVLEFPGGYGFLSSDGSEYRAALRSVLGPDAQITVAACDGAPRAVVLADRPVRPNARLDIDIPANELTINVSDTFTREALNGAIVRYSVTSKLRPSRVLFSRTFTAEDGRVVITAVPEREIRLNVSHAGYQKQDVDPFSITKSEKRTVDVQLVPLRGNRGKIHSPLLFNSASVLWFSPSGLETERAELAADGTFVYASSHGSDETMVVVSLSHPLWVLRTPELERRQSFELRFPDAPVRDVDVVVQSAGGRGFRYFGIVVGRVRVPLPALAHHQSLRRLSATVREGSQVRVPALAETGPIAVLLGPLTTDVTGRGVSGMDLFALPQFRDPPRRGLMPGAASVVFDVDRGD